MGVHTCACVLLIFLSTWKHIIHITFHSAFSTKKYMLDLPDYLTIRNTIPFCLFVLAAWIPSYGYTLTLSKQPLIERYFDCFQSFV